jgi:hypothetical protein
MIGSDISYNVTFLTDEYTGNETIEGAYSVTMNITYENGSEEQITVKMNVPEPVSDDVITVDPVEDQTGLQAFLDKAINLVKSVWSFGKSIVNFGWNSVLYPVYEFVFLTDETIVPNDETTTETQTTETQTTETQTTEITTQDPVQELPADPTTDIPVNEI